MKCNVSVMPVKGKPTTTEVQYDGAATVSAILERAGKSASTRFHIFVNGTPADLASIVPDGANVSLTEKAAGS